MIYCVCRPVTRKPEHDVAQQAANMLSVGAKPALVADVLHRQNIPIATKDIYNIRQKLRFNGMSSLKCVTLLFTLDSALCMSEHLL